MNRITRRLRHALVPSVLRDERGLSTVEYTIVLVLIAVAGMGLWHTFGTDLSTRITDSTTQLNEHVNVETE